MLTKWRGNVSTWLTEDDAAVKIMPKFRHLVTAAWRFLTQHGYINFGVAPAIVARSLKTDPKKGRVIVIGAGLAGGPIQAYRFRNIRNKLDSFVRACW